MYATVTILRLPTERGGWSVDGRPPAHRAQVDLAVNGSIAFT